MALKRRKTRIGEILNSKIEGLKGLLSSGTLTKKDTISIKIELDKTSVELYKKGLTDAAAATLAFKDKVASIIQQLAVDELAQVGVLIGNAFSGGNIKSAIAGFASLLGDALIQIGKFTIKTVIQIEAIQKAIAALIKGGGLVGGIVAVGLGVAAIALGTALKNR